MGLFLFFLGVDGGGLLFFFLLFVFLSLFVASGSVSVGVFEFVAGVLVSVVFVRWRVRNLSMMIVSRSIVYRIYVCVLVFFYYVGIMWVVLVRVALISVSVVRIASSRSVVSVIL